MAQHLRRASIIETRKARLADRAVHAEQVRLRAAVAKAAASRSSNSSEERALAAQQARERHLAQVAAACAEEVRRAKKVAEDMKERKAAEERRYRMEMEERLAEAERRRLEYKRNARRPRAASISAPENKKRVLVGAVLLDEPAAARRIQKAWRRRARKLSVDKFLDLGLTIDEVHDAEFENISNFLSEEKVVVATSKILELFGLRSASGDRAEDGTKVRTFLSAYLILGHPASVLSKDGDQEQDLINKSKDLIITFESALSKLATASTYLPTPTHVETISQSHTAFVAAFAAWKGQDFSALVETMVASFVELDAIWQTVKDDTSGEVANDYREGIRDNQVRLLARIKKLVGGERTNQMILKAIRESRRMRSKRRRPLGDTRPRVATQPDASSNGTPIVTDGAVSESREMPRPMEPEAQRAADQSQRVSLTRLFSPLPANRVLTHELAMDKDYRIELAPADVRTAVYGQVCESMKLGFENGQGTVWTVAMAENIRAKLLRLLKPGNSMHALISEALDPAHIHTECSKGLFSYEKFFSFMASILPKLCAPFRDAEVKALAEDLERPGAELSEMIGKLLRLLQVIDYLSLDYSNYLLTQAAPTLLKEAAGYEQRMFAHDLETKAITLQKTKRWWSHASVNVVTEADRRNSAGDRPSFQKIYARGLVDLAIATSPLQDMDVPETLELDKERISRIRADAVRIVVVGGILLTAKNLLKRDVRSQWKAEANRMWETLGREGYSVREEDADVLPSRLLSVVESSHALPPATKAQLVGTIGRFLSQAQTGRFSDPVLKVLFQRLKAHVLTRVSASSSGERVRAVSAASEGLAATGLSEFIGRVGELVDRLVRVSEVDRKAHGVWYETVAREVEGLGGEEG